MFEFGDRGHHVQTSKLPCPRGRSALGCGPALRETDGMADTPAPAPWAASARDAVRVFNKYVTNPVMMRLAGRRHWCASVIRHTGRRTGKPYATPVVAAPVAEGFLIPLPYGTHVDWLRNLQYSGTATIQYRGRVYAVGSPEIVDAAAAAQQLSARRQRQFRRFGIGRFVGVQRADGDS
ncbi:nitroreductase family deazaflavin-dependent oxidoreductase [Nocardia sp. NPDC004711]